MTHPARLRAWRGFSFFGGVTLLAGLTASPTIVGSGPQPEDVASTARYLASDDSYFAGQLLPIDMGEHLLTK